MRGRAAARRDDAGGSRSAGMRPASPLLLGARRLLPARCTWWRLSPAGI